MSSAEFKPNPAFMQALDAGVRDGLNAIQLQTSRTLRQVLSQKGSGRIYRIGLGKAKGRNLRARGLHQASAPGKPPAVNTNRLRASWTVSSAAGGNYQSRDSFARFYRNGSKTVLEFGSRVLYAPFLEFGTRRVRPRPYVKPTLTAVGKQAARIMKVAINQRLRGSR
jgi:hypothetical protein